MNEDDTFIRLKSITQEQAMQIHTRVFSELVQELEHNNPHAPKPWNSAIPIGILRERVDKELMPYGWSFSRLINIDVGELS